MLNTAHSPLVEPEMQISLSYVARIRTDAT
jgi:hypothetical protein